MNIFNIDLHYHAGQERRKNYSLKDYLDYAYRTGRKVLGVTDHYQLYFPLKELSEGMPYENSLAGFLHYYNELVQLKDNYPGMQILFAPENNPNDDIMSCPDELIDISDYFICEFAYDYTTIENNTKAMVDRLYYIRTFLDKYNLPGFMAHPFRLPVNNRIIRVDIEPWITNIPYKNHWSEHKYEDIAHFFLFDIVEVAKTAKQLNLPIEVNGGTHHRVRSSNMPAIMQMLWGAYHYIADQGVELVPGSDLHNFVSGKNNIGQYVPYDCFEAINYPIEKISFLDQFI